MQTPTSLPHLPTSTDKLKNYLLRLLTKKQYTEYELTAKAKSHKYDLADIHIVISELVGLGLIRDDLAGDQLAIPLSGRKGKRALSIKLTQKGITGELADTLISEFRETLSQSLLQTLSRKLATIEDNYQKIYKAQQFLLSRGFTQLDEHLQTLKDNNIL